TDDVVIASTEPTTKIGCHGTAAIARNVTAPTIASRAAARDTGQPNASTCVTIHGASISPALPPAATADLASAPDSYQRTAMSSRKVAPAVSRIPADSARQRS